MRSIPKFIEQSGIIGIKPKFKWNNDLAMDFDDYENERLYEAIDSSNFKAKLSVGIVLAEWIVWRLEKLIELDDAKNRICAAWAAAININYTKNFEFQPTEDENFHEVESLKGPLEVAMCLLEDVCTEYCQGSIYLAEPVTKMAALAKHVMPDKKKFSDWLADTLRKTASIFPRGVEYDEDTGVFEASHEDSVPREFFEPDFQYSKKSARTVLNTFLRTLNPSQNPYLRTPEEMIAEGFKGTPYTF